MKNNAFRIFFITLSILLLSSNTSAFTLNGEIQPDRYTYYLTPEYGQVLKLKNEERNRNFYARVTHGELISDSTYDQAKGLSAPELITCISSIYFNKGAGANWLRVACADNNGLEYSAHQKWPPKSIAKRVCKVGENNCPSLISLSSDSWSNPQ